jgi:hypothetical protein
LQLFLSEKEKVGRTLFKRIFCKNLLDKQKIYPTSVKTKILPVLVFMPKNAFHILVKCRMGFSSFFVDKQQII